MYSKGLYTGIDLHATNIFIGIVDESNNRLFPTGYIYPKEERPVRDLLRRRLLFVRHRATYKNSLRSMMVHHTGKNMEGVTLYKVTGTELSTYLSDEVLVHMAQHLLYHERSCAV